MKTSKTEYEELVRDSERLSIINAVVKDYKYLDSQLLHILCGLQKESVPNIQPTEPAIMIEAVEDPSEKRIHETMMKLHGEGWELKSEPKPEENTPPDEPSTRPVDSSTSRKKVDRGKVMALHKAGWSLSKIADEMGCSAQRVHQIVKEENSK